MEVTQAVTELRRKFPTDWRMVRKARLPQGRLGEPYYIEWDPGAGVFGERWDRFDADGVFYDGIAHNPVSIAQYALYQHQRWCDGDPSARDRFLAQVRYLERAIAADGTYRYTVGMPQYGVVPGWISGLAQGEAASVFFRALAMTAERRYADLALRALTPLRRDVAEGGSSLLRGENVFFEEIAAAPCHILNGHLCAAFAVWESVAYGIADDEMRALHEGAVRTLLAWLPRYADDGWSFYQLAQRDGTRHYASVFYHQTHIVQLRAYAAMTGHRAFARTADEWRAGLDRWDVRARVWRDSLQWLAETVERRAVNRPAAPWRSMVIAP